MIFRGVKRSGGKGSRWPLGEMLGGVAARRSACKAGLVVSAEFCAG